VWTAPAGRWKSCSSSGCSSDAAVDVATMIRALAMTPYSQARVPGQRFRIEQWAPQLRREGIEVAFSPGLSARAMDVLYRPGHMTQKIGEMLKGYFKRSAEALRGEPAGVVLIYLRQPSWALPPGGPPGPVSSCRPGLR
jgi:hypothetical protein